MDFTEDEHRLEILRKIKNQIASGQKTWSLSLWKRLAIAASILLCLGTYFITTNNNNKTEQDISQNIVKDAKPGTDKAYLTLSSGKRILLNDALSGKLASQAGVEITKTADHQLIYKVIDQPKDQAATNFNTIETPRGGQYQVLLPDGTHVWLNSSSSLKYPASFASMKTRRVELKGEAYFEVARDKKIPFLVRINDRAEVLVLGTHFNIMAFDDEPVIKTTLIEGSVKIANNNFNNLLKPGEQAELTDAGQIVINQVDVNESIAWKNGQTLFVDQDLKSIMRQVSRWYDLDVEYRGVIPKRLFTGGISREANLSALLKILELSHINFKMEGRKIIVSP